MTELYLSRVRLRRAEASVAALARLLVPEDGPARTVAGHHLMWSLFSDGADRRRDFLWREEAPGHFLTLSGREPASSDLFEVESKPFEPVLTEGDRLGFALRANAVIARAAAPGQRGRRHDVVMDAIRDVPHGMRAERRQEAVVTAGRAWLERLGTTHGFTAEPSTAVDGYDRVTLPRKTGRPAVFGVMDLTGALRVDDPARFTAALAAGFGRGRAFGYGLMLIRRLPRRLD
jgi:CRISPR system Cascade subunit CasE